MIGFWRKWMVAWCAGVALFGAVLTGAAFEATDGPAGLLLEVMGGRGAATFDPPLRFAVALMGAVTLGWGLSLLVATRDLGAEGWRKLTLVVALWWALDGVLSLATGFWPNALSNTLFFAGFLLPVLRGGVLGPVFVAARPLKA